MMGGKNTDNEDGLALFKLTCKRSLEIMERWLTESEYLCGPKIKIADLSAACELI